MTYITLLVIFVVLSCTQAANFCGTSWADAKAKCSSSCPDGFSVSCPIGETCYADVPCATSRPPPTRPRPANTGAFVVSRAQFDYMFPSRDALYTYQGLVEAASSIFGFTTTGSLSTRRREAAAFLANIAHESCFLGCTREIARRTTGRNYCDPGTAMRQGFTSNCRKRGFQYEYYGRGPIQLSWNYNYLAAGRFLGIDLIHHPDLVATNPAIAWKTAIWFWMKSGPHRAIIRGRGFGQTIRSINGALECNGANPETVRSRVTYYRRFVNILGTTEGNGNVYC